MRNYTCLALYQSIEVLTYTCTSIRVGSSVFSSIKMAKIGLTSQEAQQQLRTELRYIASHAVKTNWLQEMLCRPPFVLLTTLLVLVAGLLLIVDFVSGMQTRTVLFEGILLIFFAFLNIGLFCWEIYVLRTRRMKSLLAKITPFLNSECPWTPLSYPTKSITTLRGALTVHAHRDGSLVNLPTTLLVSGDVIQLQEGVPTPANVALLDSEKEIHLKTGEVPPSELFHSDSNNLGSNGIRFSPEAKLAMFKVTETPIISLLRSTIGRKRSKSFLTKEKDYAVTILNVLVIIVLVLSEVINISRYLLLEDELDGSGPEVLVRLQVYTILPLLHLPLLTIWSIVNLFGTARVVLLLERGPLFLECNNPKEHLAILWHTIRKMLGVLFHPSRYPNYRIFHVLGSLTSLCAVDKEYILTSGYPTPEKVFFLRCMQAAEDTGTANEDHVEETGDSDVQPEQSETETEMDSTSLGDRTEFSKDTHTLLPKQTKFDFQTVDSDGEDHLLVPPKFETKSATSTISDAAALEVVTEILDMSPYTGSLSGLCFDEVDWETHIGSLKSIGVNALSTSHLLTDPYSWCPVGSTEALRRNLRNTSCVCPLGVEIGVTEYSQNQFEREVLLYSIGNPPVGFQRNTISRKASSSLFNSVPNVQPHMLSAVFRDQVSGSLFLMSRGSGDMISSSCSDFWDGKDLQPMTELERGTVLDFFTRRSFTSYCVALAYNPLMELNLAPVRNQKIGIFVPNNQMDRKFSDMSMMLSDMSSTAEGGEERGLNTISYSAEQIFGTLQCNQVFLGMVSLQFQPKHDVVALIEDLESGGIRFVHFTAENEVRGKIFAEKLGLEAGWNCHISLGLAPDDDDLSSDSSSEFGGHSLSTSASSSLSSVINAYQSSYIRAKLPKGIQNIRPHIKHVDNVPLLVPLFTDCTTDTIQEMIEVMQENGEVVMCTGNSWNRDNLTVFSQADISLSLIPANVEQPKCPGIGAHSLQSSHSDHHDNLSQHQAWPTPLEMASYLNSTTSQLSFGRDCNVSILSLVAKSRHIVSCIRRGLLFALGSSLSLSLLMLLASLFLLPPPLSGSHLFWFLLFITPAITLSFLSNPFDVGINSQMPNRKKKVWSEKWMFLFNLTVTCLPTVLISLMLFGLTLANICSNQVGADCHPLFGDRNRTNESPWNGWKGAYEQGLVLAQDVVALFLNIYFVTLSIRFVHRTEPIWKLWKFTSLQYILTVSGVIMLQIPYFGISQAFALHVYDYEHVADLSSVPVYVWVIGLFWPIILILLQELLKYYDKKMVRKTQRHLRLEFETKLGMNSPF